MPVTNFGAFFAQAIHSLLSVPTTPSNSATPAAQQAPESSSPSGLMTAMAPALTISIANLAPYFKNLTVSASARLLQLTATFADPKTLLAEEGNPRLLFLM